MSFCENLKRRREEKGFTQDSFSKLVGLAQPTLSQLERGSRLPNVATAKAIADALGCTVDELLKEGYS